MFIQTSCYAVGVIKSYLTMFPAYKLSSFLPLHILSKILVPVEKSGHGLNFLFEKFGSACVDIYNSVLFEYNT